MTQPCSIADCRRPVEAQGLCHAHRERLQKFGDVHAGPPLRPRRGDIADWLERAERWDSDDCLLWPFARNSAGYGHFSDNGVDVLAHRRICERVHGAPPQNDSEAAHLCGNGHLGCANGRHLAWKSHVENQADMVRHGRSQRGSKQHRARLTEDDVRMIRRSTVSHTALANRLGVSRPTISMVKSGRTWAHVR